MKTDFEERLEAVNQATLAPLVCGIFKDDSATITNWHYAPIEGGWGGSYGVYRFRGQAQIQGNSEAWSLILKAISPEAGSQLPSSQNYWKREVLVYQSGLLNDQAIPRCIAIIEHPDQEFWIWLEDINAVTEITWTHFEQMARHLGQFNGAFLTETSPPIYPWFADNPLPHFLAQAEPGMSELPRLSQQLPLSELLSTEAIKRILKLWPERQQFWAHLNRLPRTLCHHDADQRNLLIRIQSNGQPQTVAVDWALLGWGVLGQDLGSLLLGLRFYEIDIHRISDFDQMIFSAYVAGLRDVGWQGDTQQVRFGYAATTSLMGIAGPAIKWPNIARRVAALPPGVEPPKLLDAGGAPQYAALKNHLLDLGDEARDLLDHLA